MPANARTTTTVNAEVPANSFKSRRSFFEPAGPVSFTDADLPCVIAFSFAPNLNPHHSSEILTTLASSLPRANWIFTMSPTFV